MIGYTLENVLILTVFQSLVAGLILCGTGALFHLQDDPLVRKILKLFGAAFCFYSLHSLLRIVFAYRNLSSPAGLSLPGSWEILARTAESVALVCLALAYFPRSLPEQFRGRFWTLAGALVTLLAAGPHVLHQLALGWAETASIAAAMNALLLAGVTVWHLRRQGRMGWFKAAPLGVLAVAHFLRAAAPEPGRPEWLWNAESAAMLLALGLFALLIDVRSANLQVRLFLRLNLIFVVLASVLILTAAETDRREYLRAAESSAEDFTEFLRGHLLYFHGQGATPEEILASPEIIRKVTSEFGRLTDLRRVRVIFDDWGMEMSIGDNWLVSHEIYRAARGDRPRPPGERGRIVTLTPVPVLSAGRFLGRIEMDQSLRTINSRVARQMRIIFLTFTVAVLAAAGLFGFTAQHAHKTIQRQFQELKTTHAQLAHAARLASVGQLAGGVAHEINNPAGIILTTSDYLLSETAHREFPESLREDLQAIRRQARRISNIVSGLLTFSRPTPLNKRPTQVEGVLEQSLALLAPRFREQRVRVESQPVSDLPAICADPDRLEQVFVNLLNNAADAMPQGGSLTVSSAQHRENGRPGLVVSIRDTGAGIPEEHLKSIFDPFFSTKPRGRGTGLGLAISYGIIRDHGGQIQVESQVGQGATFRILLPLDKAGHEQL